MAAHDGGREHRLRPQAAQNGPRYHRQEARRHSCHHQAGPAGRALSGRIVRRPAAARGARPRADRGTGNAAARRAAVQSRRQSARGNALRGAPPARRLSLHHRLRHPRPVGGDDHRRPHRGDECRQDRAGGHAGGHLRPAALGIRRALHRLQQRGQGQSPRRSPHRPCRRRAALRRRQAQGRRRHRGLDPPARHQDFRHAAATGGKRRAGDGDAAGLSRRQPGLYG